MIDPLQIILERPICNCEEDNTAWGMNLINRASLEIKCQTCGIFISIPYEKLTASVIYKKPYLKEKKSNKSNIFKLIE